MKIIFIVDNLNDNACAIVARQFINGFSDIGVNILLITSSVINKYYTTNIPTILIPSPPAIYTIKHKISLILSIRQIASKKFNTHILHKYYTIISEFNPDIVLTFASSDGYSIIDLGNIVSHKFKIPHHIHAVDALPAPECWGENIFLRKIKIHYIKQLCSNVKIYTSTNRQMLDYQLQLIDNPDILSEIIYNPINTNFIHRDKDQQKTQVLYIGNLTSNNKGRSGIEYYKAIVQLNSINNYEFIFLGTCIDIKNKFNEIYPLPENIQFIPWTDNVDEYIKSSSLLIDIDIHADNDVYLSSKLIKYLNSDLPILSITGTNSPASNLLNIKGLGVLPISHHSQLIKNSIINSESIYVDKKIRTQFIEKFMINNIISDIINL